MSGPLSPRSSASYNQSLNPPIYLLDRIKSPTLSAKNSSIADGPPSSPFQTDVDQENRVPSEHVSALKNNAISKSGFEIHEDETLKPLAEPSQRSSATRTVSSPVKETTIQFDLNFESPTKRHADFSSNDYILQPVMDKTRTNRVEDDEQAAYDAPTVLSDDTCFSTFSAVPNADMTLFANLGNHALYQPGYSPQRIGIGSKTPCSKRPNTARGEGNIASQPPSPTPHRQHSNSRENDTTNLLLDFTHQFDGFVKPANPSPRKRGALSPNKNGTESNLLSYINNQRLPSPSKAAPMTPSGGRCSLMNLLDFDLPPQPTPRSVPTITIRELESLKSSYLSEISSLKASLSGREAEVDSLKKAVIDAERRVGEGLETVREERNAREHAEKEKSEWEKKGKELEGVLNNVKEEFLGAEKEREDLLQKLEESYRQRDETVLGTGGGVTRTAAALSPSGSEADGNSTRTADSIEHRVAQQLDEKMENLARELHAVYKKKHESKVTTLKRTYEARSEKKCQEMQQRLDELIKQNDDLRTNKDANVTSSSEEGSGTSPPLIQAQLDRQRSEMAQHEARITRLTEQLDDLSQTHTKLQRDLEKERAEKGELVAAVDEMLALQMDAQATNPGPSLTPSVTDDFRKTVVGGRPSGLRAPGSFGMESRIGRFGGGGASALPAGLSRTSSAGKSRMMSNIERMGSGSGKGVE